MTSQQWACNFKSCILFKIRKKKKRFQKLHSTKLFTQHAKVTIFTTLLADSSNDKLMIVFLFSEKTFVFAWNINLICLGKITCHLLGILPSMLSVNSAPDNALFSTKKYRAQLFKLVKGHFVNCFSRLNTQYSDMFCWKNVSSFCTFFQQKISAYLCITRCKF